MHHRYSPYRKARSFYYVLLHSCVGNVGVTRLGGAFYLDKIPRAIDVLLEGIDPHKDVVVHKRWFKEYLCTSGDRLFRVSQGSFDLIVRWINQDTTRELALSELPYLVTGVEDALGSGTRLLGQVPSVYLKPQPLATLQSGDKS